VDGRRACVGATLHLHHQGQILALGATGTDGDRRSDFFILLFRSFLLLVISWPVLLFD
jgi:hypothetical protein